MREQEIMIQQETKDDANARRFRDFKDAVGAPVVAKMLGLILRKIENLETHIEAAKQDFDDIAEIREKLNELGIR